MPAGRRRSTLVAGGIVSLLLLFLMVGIPALIANKSHTTNTNITPAPGPGGNNAGGSPSHSQTHGSPIDNPSSPGGDSRTSTSQPPADTPPATDAGSGSSSSLPTPAASSQAPVPQASPPSVVPDQASPPPPAVQPIPEGPLGRLCSYPETQIYLPRDVKPFTYNLAWDIDFDPDAGHDAASDTATDQVKGHVDIGVSISAPTACVVLHADDTLNVTSVSALLPGSYTPVPGVWQPARDWC